MICTELETRRLRLRLFTHDDLNVTKLVALIVTEIVASVRVAEKLGMRRGPLIHIYDVDAIQYEMEFHD